MSDLILDSSKLNDFLKCPRYYFYRHHLGWQSELTSNHLIFGSSVHIALEHVLLHGYDNNSIVSAFEAFLADYRKTYSPEQDDIFEPKTPDNFFLILKAYCDHYKRDLDHFEVLYTEIAGTVAISGESVIALRMDSILRDRRDGKVYSLEHKTCSSLYLWAEQWLLALQIGTYTHALNCLFPDEKIGSVIMNGIMIGKTKSSWLDLRTKGFTKNKTPWEFIREPVAKSKDQMQVWLDRVNNLVVAVNEHTMQLDYAANDQVLSWFPLNSLACSDYGRLCEFHPFCCAWPNPLKKCENVPMGFKKEFWNPLQKEAKKKIEL